MNLQPDSLVDELRHLAPEVSVAGGSFGCWLRHPGELPLKPQNTPWLAVNFAIFGCCSRISVSCS